MPSDTSACAHISRVVPGRRDIAANVLVWVILIPKKKSFGSFVCLFVAVFFVVFLG